MSKFFFKGRPDVMGNYGKSGFSPNRNKKVGSAAHPISIVVNSAERKLAVEKILEENNIFAEIELAADKEENINELEVALNIPKTQVFEKVPARNEPCLCGSGKKYKKCCG
jgi:SWIM/SEC-C metal-binding protein